MTNENWQIRLKKYSLKAAVRLCFDKIDVHIWFCQTWTYYLSIIIVIIL